MQDIESPALARFVRREFAAGRENRPRERQLLFRVDLGNRCEVHVKRSFAFVQQCGRFAGDAAFWKATLGREARIEPAREGRRLRFYLRSNEDFARFRALLEDELPGKKFLSPPPAGAPFAARRKVPLT